MDSAGFACIKNDHSHYWLLQLLLSLLVNPRLLYAMSELWEPRKEPEEEEERRNPCVQGVAYKSWVQATPL